jgi:molybdopterin/thiamine biosynthesis adenylyltransferase
VLVCGLTAAAKNAYEASLVEIKGTSRKVKLENATAKLLVRTVVNRQRQALFTEGDIERLGTKSAAALERLTKVAQRLSAMNQDEVEALVKNSEATQSDDSPTVSL